MYFLLIWPFADPCSTNKPCFDQWDAQNTFFVISNLDLMFICDYVIWIYDICFLVPIIIELRYWQIMHQLANFVDKKLTKMQSWNNF